MKFWGKDLDLLVEFVFVHVLLCNLVYSSCLLMVREDIVTYLVEACGDWAFSTRMQPELWWEFRSNKFII